MTRGAAFLEIPHPAVHPSSRCCLLPRGGSAADPGAMDDLVAMLGDPDARVRSSALHALTCDRCKEGSCRPIEAKVLPRAIALLAADPDAHVRAHAIGFVGRWVHTNPAAEVALLRAMRSDSSASAKRLAGAGRNNLSQDRSQSSESGPTKPNIELNLYCALLFQNG